MSERDGCGYGVSGTGGESYSGTTRICELILCSRWGVLFRNAADLSVNALSTVGGPIPERRGFEHQSSVHGGGSYSGTPRI